MMKTLLVPPSRRVALSLLASSLANLPSVARPATPMATIDLPGGSLIFRLLPDAPRAVALFTELANAGFYDDSAFHAIHGDSAVGGDPNSRLGYGPNKTLVNGGFFYGKVRAWGSDESKVFGGARTACPAGTVEACTLARRVPTEATPGRQPAFGTLALALGGQPGMVVGSRAGTVGSQFEIGLGPKEATYYPYGKASPPVIGELVEGEQLLRSLAMAPVTNDYLSESKGRGMRGTPGFARPRDIPRDRQTVLRVRVG